MKKDLIYDNGKIRNCISNKRNMNYFQLVYHFCWYSISIKEIRNSMKEIINAIKLILSFMVFIILFPIVPFIRGYFTYKESRKENI